MRLSLNSPRLALVGLTLGCLAGPGLVLGQDDPAARSLIEQLRPQIGNGTRGIRLPAAPPADVVTPAPDPLVGQSTGPAPPQPLAVQPPVVPPTQFVAPMPPLREPPKTTAPEGVAAVSITVTFPSGSATLTPRARDTLAPLGRALSSADLAAYHFRIEGHTDSVGDEWMNQRLSELRAQSVRDYLIKQYGVAPQRLEAVGLGESSLLVPTGDGVDEPQNRRVQIINLDG